MKTQFCYLVTILAIVLVSFSELIAQEQKQSTNPFPLTEKKRRELLKNFRATIAHFKEKYTDPNLATWNEKDRNAYLKAKAVKVILLFVPDFYREYKEPEIVREYSGKGNPVFKNKPWYTLNFFYDPTYEKLVSPIIIYVHIWEENGEAASFIIPSYNWGESFRPPYWEDGLYKERVRNNDTLQYPYRTGWEDIRKSVPLYVRMKARADSLRRVYERSDSLRRIQERSK